ERPSREDAPAFGSETIWATNRFHFWSSRPWAMVSISSIIGDSSLGLLFQLRQGRLYFVQFSVHLERCGHKCALAPRQHGINERPLTLRLDPCQRQQLDTLVEAAPIMLWLHHTWVRMRQPDRPKLRLALFQFLLFERRLFGGRSPS